MTNDGYGSMMCTLARVFTASSLLFASMSFLTCLDAIASKAGGTIWEGVVSSGRTCDPVSSKRSDLFTKPGHELCIFAFLSKQKTTRCAILRQANPNCINEVKT